MVLKEVVEREIASKGNSNNIKGAPVNHQASIDQGYLSKDNSIIGSIPANKAQHVTAASSNVTSSSVSGARPGKSYYTDRQIELGRVAQMQNLASADSNKFAENKRDNSYDASNYLAYGYNGPLLPALRRAREQRQVMQVTLSVGIKGQPELSRVIPDERREAVVNAFLCYMLVENDADARNRVHTEARGLAMTRPVFHQLVCVFVDTLCKLNVHDALVQRMLENVRDIQHSFVMKKVIRRRSSKDVLLDCLMPKRQLVKFFD